MAAVASCLWPQKLVEVKNMSTEHVDDTESTHHRGPRPQQMSSIECRWNCGAGQVYITLLTGQRCTGAVAKTLCLPQQWLVLTARQQSLHRAEAGQNNQPLMTAERKSSGNIQGLVFIMTPHRFAVSVGTSHPVTNTTVGGVRGPRLMSVIQ